MGSWGKRNYYDFGKKRWANMGSWGKRTGTELGDKRWANMSSWGKRWANMSSWGKRSSDDKKWANMSSWGKRRNSEEDTAEKATPVKKWTNASFWGKRGVKPPEMLFKKWVRRPLRRSSWGLWGKRPSWSQVGFSSWGKRSDDLDLHHRLDSDVTSTLPAGRRD